MAVKKEVLNNKMKVAVEKATTEQPKVEDSRCIIAKCPSFPDIHKMLIRGVPISNIVQYMLDKDEFIIKYYEGIAPDVAYQRLTKVFEKFREKYYTGKAHVPAFLIEAYKIQKGKFDELEDMESLLGLMFKRLDMYHDLELKGGIPMKDVPLNVQTAKDLIDTILRMKQSLGIVDKAPDKIELGVDSKIAENFENMIKESKNPKDFLGKMFKTKL